MKKFSKWDDLVFTKTDKGGVTGRADIENYIEKSNKELNNEHFYKKLNHDPTQEHAKIITDTIEIFQLQQVLSKKYSW